MSDLDELYAKHTSEEALDDARIASEHIETPKTPLTHKPEARGARIETTLDVHGMTSIEAHNAIAEYLIQCKKTHQLKVLIVTGKGQGILRDTARNVLTAFVDNKTILDFAVAPANKGGKGAFVVWL